MPDIYDLMRTGVRSTAYIEKMMHPVPRSRVVDRIDYILRMARNQRILHLGSASGPLHAAIAGTSRAAVGVDRAGTPDIRVDLDALPEGIVEIFRQRGPYDLLIAGEILEHLANPGRLLGVLRELDTPLLVSVPNAHSAIGRSYLEDAIENVNKDHVAWYSYTTLKTLLGRYGFGIKEFYWYNGRPLTAEGLIVLAS